MQSSREASGPVLIISHLFEPNVNRVIAQLDRLDVAWHRINVEEFPLLLTISATFDAEAPSIVHEGSLLEQARSIWFRRTSLPVLPRRLSETDRSFVRGEVGAFFEGALDAIPAFWVNNRIAERAASNKLRQLRIAVDAGLKIPETLATNDPSAVSSFVERCDGRIIFKPISGFAPRSADFSAEAASRFAAWGDVSSQAPDMTSEVEIVFAQLLDAEKMAGLGALRLCPAVFQRFIEKSADIRVTIVGDALFACRIYSQDRAETSVDFRRMTLLDNVRDIRHELIDLPSETLAGLRTVMDRLGIVFGCVDLVEEEDGTLTFLEVNPAGQWMWIEQFTGAPITETLALLLANGPPIHSDKDVGHAGGLGQFNDTGAHGNGKVAAEG